MNIARVSIYLCNVSCIIPPVLCSQSVFLKKVQKYWAFFVITSILLLSGISTYWRILYVYSTMDGVIAFLDQLSHSSFTLTNLLSSIEITFFSSSFQDFFHKLSKLPCDPAKSTWMDSLNKPTFFLVFNISILFTLGWDMAFWLQFIGIRSYVLYILRSFQFYQNGLNIYLLVCVCGCLKKHLRMYNEKLVKFMEDFKESNAVTFSLNSQDFDFRELRKFQGGALDLIPHFNRIFGRNILLILFNCIVNIILYTSIFLAFLKSERGFEVNWINFGLYGTCFCWIFESMTFPILLATVCEKTLGEARRSTDLSLGYLNDIPTVPETEEMKILKEELQMFLQQTQAKKLSFSAGGFFVIDYTMLGLILSSVTSYIIVVLQFIKSPICSHGGRNSTVLNIY